MKKRLTFIAMLLTLGFVASFSRSVWAGEEAGAKPTKEAAPKGEGESEGESAKKSKGPTDVAGGRFAGDPIYVHLSPIVLPVIDAKGVEQLITVQIDVEVKDFDVADNIHSHMPRVMDALMRALYGGFGRGALLDGKMVDISKMKAKATVAMEEVVGGDGVRNVLIQSVSQRML